MKDRPMLLRCVTYLMGAYLILVSVTAAWADVPPQEMFRQAWRQWVTAIQLKSQQPPASPAQLRPTG